MKNIPCLVLLFVVSGILRAAATNLEVASPDGKLSLAVTISEEQGVGFVLGAGTEQLLRVENICLDTTNGRIPAPKTKAKKTSRRTVSETVIPVIAEKNARIADNYTELKINFDDEGSVALEFRLFNNGAAWRFVTAIPGELTITHDNADFIFDERSTLTFQRDNKPNSDFEKPYVTKTLGEIDAGDMGNLPALVRLPSGKNIVLLEAATEDYLCMWLTKTKSAISSHYWGVPAAYNPKGNERTRHHITKFKDYIARTSGTRSFPWKVVGVADNDADLISNQLVYLLGPENRIKGDTAWIKPGWVAFDWWARHGIYGVDFKAGVNTETAKYMIDFASAFGIRYFLFDHGWRQGTDLTKPIPELDMEAVIKHAKEKNVSVMLWVVYALFDEQMEAALDQYQKWGIKGVKIDFMNRSDQEMVNFYWRAAEACARREMVIDFHGAYRPDGLRRAYPNVLTREALIEFEYNGLSADLDTPDLHCTLPFIRGVAGPMDYIPGTMRNATKRNWVRNSRTPFGQGTRAHSMALAIIMESPMQMLPDAPPEYYQQRECTTFLTQIPVTWDETVPLAGRVGDFVAIARRNAAAWHVAAITDWTPRTLTLTFDILEAGKTYRAEIFKDGVNADTNAVDYKAETRRVKKGDTLEIPLAAGGGWIAKFTPVN